MTYIENENIEEPVETAMLSDTEMDDDMETPEVPEQVTMQYILRCIRDLQEDKEFLYNAIEKLGSVKSEGPGDVGAEAKANAIAHAVKVHEETNRRLVDFYEHLYGDLFQEHIDSILDLDLQHKAMWILANSPKDCATLGSLSNVFETIRHINE